MNVLLVDEHVIAREGLKSLLLELAVTARFLEAASFQEAIRITDREAGLDLLIVEQTAPGLEAGDGLRTFREQLPATPIVVLSPTHHQMEALRLIELGANGIIPRSASGRVFLSAVKLILEGETYVPSAFILGRGAVFDDRENVPPHYRGALRRLTPRQRDVLRLVVDGHSNAAMAARLGLETNTIKNHVKAILKTLGVSSRTKAMAEAVRLGARPSGAPPVVADG